MMNGSPFFLPSITLSLESVTLTSIFQNVRNTLLPPRWMVFLIIPSSEITKNYFWGYMLKYCYCKYIIRPLSNKKIKAYWTNFHIDLYTSRHIRNNKMLPTNTDFDFNRIQTVKSPSQKLRTMTFEF